MKLQRYARQDPYPHVPFNVARRMTDRRRHFLEDLFFGVTIGLMLAYIIFFFASA